MAGNVEANDGGVVDNAGQADARSTALHLMTEALTCLDGDSHIPAYIGAHLQSAIDALWTSASPNRSSIQLH